MKAHDKEQRLQQLLKKDSETGLLLSEYEEYRQLTWLYLISEEDKKEARKTVDDWIMGGFKGNPWADCEEE